MFQYSLIVLKCPVFKVCGIIAIKQKLEIALFFYVDYTIRIRKNQHMDIIYERGVRKNGNTDLAESKWHGYSGHLE